MATHYLYGTILTSEAVAANNRGDNVGNTTTLQKVFVKDELHTSVSAESIRFALRYRFQLEGLKVNRSYDGEKLDYSDEKRAQFSDETGSDNFVDDDIMGFMDAEAAKQEKEEETAAPDPDATVVEGEKKKGKGKGEGKKAKGKTTKRTSPLSVGRAISLRPYRGELSFNCVSGEKKKGALSLYNAEMHTTEYQYSFGLNLGDVVKKENIRHVIDAIVDPPQVAGNHTRFAYDFSPASIVLRVTPSHSSRIQNCFEHDEESKGFSLRRLVEKVKAGDIPAGELLIGGEAARTEEGKELKAKGAFVVDGVRAAATEAQRRIAAVPGYKSVGP